MSAEQLGRTAGALWKMIGIPGRVIFGGALVALCAMTCTGSKEKSMPPIAQAAITVDPALEQQKEATRRRENMAFVKTAALASALKASLRDPDSLVWEAILSDEYASVVCLQYRARNGFGGMNREILIYAGSIRLTTAEAWNKFCLKDMRQMKHVKNAI